MATKFERLLYILNLVDRGAKCTPKGLAEELSVDERSIFRYKNSLEEAGFPIFFDEARGSYSFVEGFHLKKASLGTDEILALAMAKKVLGAFGKAFEGAFESLEKKILSVSASKGAAVPTAAMLLPSQKTVVKSDVSKIAKDLVVPIMNHTLISISYESLHSKELTEREIEPYYLFFSDDGFWNLRAFCRMRNDWRVFALDRIKSLKLLGKSFVPRLFGDDAGKELASSFGTFMDGDSEEVVVQFSPEIRPYVERRIWHPSQENRDLDNGWLEVRFVTSGTEGLKYWLYRWTPHFKVVRPEQLRLEMIEDLELQKKRMASDEK